MIAGTAAKVQCPYCPLKVHRGNLARHVTACLRSPEERRRLDFERRMRRMVNEREGGS